MLDAHRSMNPVRHPILLSRADCASCSRHFSPELSPNHRHQPPLFPELTGIFGFRFQNFAPLFRPSILAKVDVPHLGTGNGSLPLTFVPGRSFRNSPPATRH